MEKSFSIQTLGCKVNQYNSQLVRENLISYGFEEKKQGKFQIINGCMVTQQAERKTRKLIYRALRTGEKVIVTGCYTRGNSPLDGVFFIPEENKVVKYVTGEYPSLAAISSFHSHTRAFVKVQQGCPRSCSYCVIPRVRGNVYSRKTEEILNEVETLSPFYPELVITGTHLGLYRDEGKDLTYLLEEILQRAKFSRIRLSSIEITELTPSLLSLFNHPKLCPHLHVPLQSGSDRILKLMRRPYTQRYFLKTVERIKKEYPDIAFTTDIMVGFPTEEDKDFEDTLNLVREIAFSRIHIFPYSSREGTEAAKLTPHVPEIVKKEREKRLKNLATTLSFNFRKQFIGKDKQVLLEHKKRNGRLWGYSEDYIPVELENKQEAAPERIYSLTITRSCQKFNFGYLNQKMEVL